MHRRACILIGSIVVLLVAASDRAWCAPKLPDLKPAPNKLDMEMLALMPADVSNLEFTNVESFLALKRFQPHIEKEFKDSARYELLRKAGLGVGDLKSTLIGHSPTGLSVAVFRLAKEAEVPKFTANAAELKVLGKSYWMLKKEGPRVYFAMPAPSVILIATNEQRIEDILTRKDSKPAINKHLSTLAQLVAEGNRWSAFVSTKESKLETDDPGLKALLRTTGSAESVQLGEKTIATLSYMTFDSEDDAKAAAEQIRVSRQKSLEFIDKGKFTDAQKESLIKSIKEASVSQKGKVVKSKSTLDASPFEGLDGLAFP